jgi:hypothetical protein
MARLDEYQISDDELRRVNILIMGLRDNMIAEFGDRADIVMTSVIGSQLAHRLADGDEGFQVWMKVNDWLAVAAKPSRQHGMGTGDEEREEGRGMIWMRRSGRMRRAL